jgi:hypothetical protein
LSGKLRFSTEEPNVALAALEEERDCKGLVVFLLVGVNPVPPTTLTDLFRFISPEKIG